MNKNETRCVDCELLHNHTRNRSDLKNMACVISTHHRENECPCKFCIVKTTCYLRSQMCFEFAKLLDECERTIQK